MHGGHDHDHHHHHHGNGSTSGAAGAGHNHAQPVRGTVQWQTPHKPHEPEQEHGRSEPDLDLVEAAFVQGFTAASDPTSFLRLARIPFEAVDPDGTKLVMLRVETDQVTDVGSVTPHLGGGAMRYDPLPAKFIGRRQKLRFVYFDGAGLRHLTIAQVRELTAAA